VRRNSVRARKNLLPVRDRLVFYKDGQEILKVRMKGRLVRERAVVLNHIVARDLQGQYEPSYNGKQLGQLRRRHLMEARNVAFWKDEHMSLRQRFPSIEDGKQRIGLAECIDLDLTGRALRFQRTGIQSKPRAKHAARSRSRVYQYVAV